MSPPPRRARAEVPNAPRGTRQRVIELGRARYPGDRTGREPDPCRGTARGCVSACPTQPDSRVPLAVYVLNRSAPRAPSLARSSASSEDAPRKHETGRIVDPAEDALRGLPSRAPRTSRLTSPPCVYAHLAPLMMNVGIVVLRSRASDATRARGRAPVASPPLSPLAHTGAVRSPPARAIIPPHVGTTLCASYRALPAPADRRPHAVPTPFRASELVVVALPTRQGEIRACHRARRAHVPIPATTR